MFKPFHDRSLIDKVSDIKPNRVAEKGQNKSNEKSNYEIEIKKQVGTPTKARAGFKKGCPKYGRPQWAFEN